MANVCVPSKSQVRTDNPFAPQNDNGLAFPPPAPLAPLAAARLAAEVEACDGSRAVEVQSRYRGVITHTRHLTDATGRSTASLASALVAAGLAAVLIALAVFFGTVVSAGRERARYDAFVGAGQDAKSFPWTRPSPGRDAVVFGGLALGVALVYAGLKRRGRAAADFTIGADAKADAPVATELIGARAFALVSARGTGFLVNVTPAMAGEACLDGRPVSLAELVRQRGPSFSLGERGTALIACGDTSFSIRATAAPRRLPVPLWASSWREQGYHAGTAAVLLLFLAIVFSVPPDAKSLSLEHFSAERGLLPVLLTPPAPKDEALPAWLDRSSPDEPGGRGRRHDGAEGVMGKSTAKNRQGLYAIRGPEDNQDPHLAKQRAAEDARNRGILGVLRGVEGSPIASIWGRTTALGSDTENVLGGLLGAQIGESYGLDGLALVGTGSGGGGTGQQTLGLDGYGTLGKGGGGGKLAGYGRGAGGLAGRKPKVPGIVPGQATVRGSLDKEIIRRIIRRHLNEVKFCYEAELARNASLAGRVAVQFTISGGGEVIASVLQSSTMGNARVESCVVQAVRRWEFPRPALGGLVIVSYPFNFQSGA